MFLGCFWGVFRVILVTFGGVTCTSWHLTILHMYNWHFAHNTSLHCNMLRNIHYMSWQLHNTYETSSTFRISVSFTRSYSCLRLIVSIFLDTVLSHSSYNNNYQSIFITLVSIHFDDTHLIHSILYGFFDPIQTLPAPLPLRVSCKNDRVFSVDLIQF